MVLYVPSHAEVKNIGLCIGRFDNTDPMDVINHPWAKYVGSLHPYALAISVSDDFVLVFFVSSDINECIRLGKNYIANIGDPIIDIHNHISQDIMSSLLERRINMIKVESVDDVPVVSATEELNKTEPEEEKQHRLTEEKIDKCHNCAHYLPSYNVCRMTISDIKFTKGCTAYDPIIKNKE